MPEPQSAFVKDGDGRIAINCGGAIIPKTLADTDRASRNVHGRVFVKNGESFTVTATVNGVDYVVCDGTASAKTGKMCCLFVRVRAEADVDEPAEPEVVI